MNNLIEALNRTLKEIGENNKQRVKILRLEEEVRRQKLVIKHLKRKRYERNN